MKLLIAEDNQKMLELLVQAFNDDIYDVEQASDGIEASSKLVEGQFDVAILDWMMPDKSGIEVLEIVGKYEIETPIIFLTAKSQIEDKLEAFDKGAIDYMTKPFSIEELRARVNIAARSKTKSKKNSTIELDDLVIDIESRTVVRNGKQVELSKLEFDLLVYLSQRSPAPVSNIDLLENVWGEEYKGLSNVVTVYIGYLRKKIDKNFNESTPLIKTVRGVGYKLESIKDE